MRLKPHCISKAPNRLNTYVECSFSAYHTGPLINKFVVCLNQLFPVFLMLNLKIACRLNKIWLSRLLQKSIRSCTYGICYGSIPDVIWETFYTQFSSLGHHFLYNVDFSTQIHLLLIIQKNMCHVK